MMVLRVGRIGDPEEQIARWRVAMPPAAPDATFHGEDWVAMVAGPHADIQLADGFPLLFQGELHYRQELASSLGAGTSGNEKSSLLAARAFGLWGLDAPAHLEGSWAVARWREGRLEFSPDHVSTVTLFHAALPDGHVVSTSLPHILACDGFAPDLDGQNLALMIAGYPAPGRTAWAGIATVPPGHSCHWSRSSSAVAKEWWKPEEAIDHGSGPKEREADFRRIWSEAVEECVGDGRDLGIFLSAGLDSTLVAGWVAPRLAAGGLPLLALTESPAPGLPLPDAPGRVYDEWPLASEFAASHPNIRHRRVLSGDAFLPDTLAWLHERFATPLRNSANFGWIRSGFEVASGEGATRVLWGARGNATVSYRVDLDEALAECLRVGRWRHWWRCLPRRQFARRLLAGIATLARPDRGRIRLRARLASSVIPETLAYAPVRDGLRAGMARELDAYLGQGAFSRKSMVQLAARGFSAHLGELHGIANIDPTADRRVIEASIRRPLADHLDGPWNRAIARRLAAGLVPDAIRFATDRGTQGGELAGTFVRDAERYRETWALCRDVPGFDSIVDIEAATRILEDLVAGRPAGRRVQAFIRALDTGIFLAGARTRWNATEIRFPPSPEARR